MADLRIVDAPLLSTVKGTEKIPTGGEGNFSVSVNQVADFAKLKWVLATEGYVDNAVGNVQADLNLHKNNSSNPHQVTKVQVGLGNVDNTADADKPVSNSTQAVIISAVSPKADKTYVDNQLTFKANKVDVYTKQESSDLVNNSISTALSPVNSSLDLAKRGIVNRYDSSLTYNLSERVVLTNGDIVKSTINGNTNDPNVDMTGWYNTTRLNQPINFEMFRADKSGLIVCDTLIQAAFDLSKTLKTPVHNFSGTYYLNSPLGIEISYSYDLTGTVFKCGPNFGGFRITRNAVTTTHDSSSALVTLLKTQGVLAAGVSNLSVLASNSTYDNYYIKVYTSQQMYNYRGDIQTRFELNRILKRGQLLGDFMFDLDFTLLTKIDTQKVADTVFVGTGLSIDETSVSDSVTLVSVENGNSFDLRNFKFIDNASAVASNTKNKISLGVNVHDVRIDYVDTSAVYINSANDSNYTVIMGENFNVELSKICSEGYGWGAVGGNNCRRVKFKDSQLNRIDFHKHCHELLQIDDCTIGNWGVLVTMLGDLIINNPTFLMRNAYNNNGFIRSRDDTGGFCNGNLIINNPVFKGDASLTKNKLLRCQRNASYALPVGTPIRSEFWTNIEINSAYAHQNLIDDIISSNQGSSRALMLPRSIKINGFKTDVAQSFNFYMNHFAKRDEGVNLVINDMTVSTLNLLDNDNIGTKIFAEITSIRKLDNTGTAIANRCDGEFDFNQCKIMKYREFNSAYSTFTPIVNFNGGSLSNTTDTTYFDCASESKLRIQANSMRLNYGDESAMRNDLHFFTAKSCTWNGAKYFPLYSGGGSATTTTFTLPISGDVTIIIRNNVGKIDTITVSTTVAVAATTLPNVAGTITTTLGSTMSIQVNAANLLSVGMVSN